jgi:hypothetical protein
MQIVTTVSLRGTSNVMYIILVRRPGSKPINPRSSVELTERQQGSLLGCSLNRLVVGICTPHRGFPHAQAKGPQEYGLLVTKERLMRLRIPKPRRRLRTDLPFLLLLSNIHITTLVNVAAIANAEERKYAAS